MPKRATRKRPTSARPARRTARATAPPDASARERILAAALAVFADHGFDGARTRDIALRAGVNLGLLSYYFDGKETLWQAAVTRVFEALAAHLAEAAAPQPGDDERDELERLLRAFVAFVAERPEFMRLMNDESKRDGPRMRWLVDRHVGPTSAGLRRRIERAQANGVLPAIPLVSAYYIAVGAAGLVFSQAPECLRATGVDPTDPAFAKAHADALVALMLGPARG